MPPGSDWRRLHPLSPLLRAGRFVAVAAAFLADDLAARVHLSPAWGGLFLLGALVAGAGAGWWVWSATGYRVTDEEVELRTGVLFRRHRRLPLARLETIDLARPLVARFFGLTQVRLEAVSQGESEVRLSYVDESTALALRDELRDHLKSPPAGDVEPEAVGAGPPPPGIRVPTAELLAAFVLGRIVVVWPALLMIALVVLGAVGPGAALAFSIAVGVPVGIVPLAVGLAEAERLYGFTLTERSRGFDISRGLFNQMHQAVPVDRVQAVAVIEPLLWRRFGRVRLVVDVAGYRGGSNEDRDRTAVLLPIAPKAVVADVLRRVQPDLHLEGLANVPAPAAARWRAPVRWRGYSVSWDGAHAVTRRGLLRRRTDIVPHRKVQSLRVTQGPWQRALGLATLHLDTAGTRIRARALHRGRDDAERLAWDSRHAALTESERR
jgi:putative membrane protein